MKTPAGKYNIPKGWSNTYEVAIDNADLSSLEKWAANPNCIQSELCAAELEKRRKRKEALAEASRVRLVVEQERLAKRREALELSPFDPRTEISADAKHIARRIVKHMWIIFVLLPVAFGLLYAIVTSK